MTTAAKRRLALAIIEALPEATQRAERLPIGIRSWRVAEVLVEALEPALDTLDDAA